MIANARNPALLLCLTGPSNLGKPPDSIPALPVYSVGNRVELAESEVTDRLPFKAS
jgi:hypothetical protein